MAALLACTAMLGTGTAFADTLVKNLGKGTSGATHDLSATDASQAFTTGSTADAYELTGVKVQFGTAPTSTATVSAIITDGQAVTDNIVATLTNPGTWATTSTFAVPSGITLDASTTYYLIIDATDGILATTSSNSEDSGGVTGWSIADSRTKRAMVSDSGLGGTWGPSSNTLKIAVEGDHKGTVTACSAASMADRVWAGSMTAGKFAFGNETLFGWNPTGTFSGSNLTDDDFSFAGETYTFESIYWGVAVGETVGELLIAFADMAAGDIATKATRDSLILHVGNNRFNLGDGTYNTGSRGVTWSNTNLNWNQYDRVCLAITEESPPGAHALTAAAKTESIILTWTVDDHGTSDITRFEYRIKETTGGTYSNWTDTGAAASNTGGTATIGSLTNGTGYTVQVRGVNGEGDGEASTEESATPDAPPSITSVEITSDPGTDKTYAIGDNIVVTVTFDKVITLGTGTIDPYLSFYIGTEEEDANCVVGTDTATLICTETVAEGDEDSDGVRIPGGVSTVNKLVLGPLGQRANLSHSGLATDSNHKVDGIRPTLTTSGSDAPRTSTDGTKVILKFSKSLSAVDHTKITIQATVGATTQPASTSGATVNGSTVELTLTTPVTSNVPTLTVALDADAVTDLVGNGNSTLAATSLVNNFTLAEWELTLTDTGGNAVTQLVEGGPSATATVRITNSARFSTPQTVTLYWLDAAVGGTQWPANALQGAGGVHVITIPAMGTSGELEVSARQDNLYLPRFAGELEGRFLGTRIDGVTVSYLDDEPVPELSISADPLTVTEGSGFDVTVTATQAYLAISYVSYEIADPAGVLSGTPESSVVLAPGATSGTLTFATVPNMAMETEPRAVVFTLAPDETALAIHALDADASLVTVTVLDDDTPPTAPQNLMAQAGNTEARLTWQAPLAPTPDHGQPVLRYEYRVKVGSAAFGNWTTILNSDATTTSHTFTGLANDTLHTYEVRAVNVAGVGAEAQVMVTPIVGVAVSFGAAALSVDEGGTVTVTVTLAEAPAAGTTVTVPIVVSGPGFNAVVGVPMQVIFAAGETSKTFVMHAQQDTFDEPDEVLTLSLGTLPDGYVPGTHATFVLTVVDDDDPIVSATFGAATASAPEGASVEVTVRLSQAPEREVVLPIVATRGANLAAAEVEGVPASVTFAADETQARFSVSFLDDAAEEGNETLTLTFGTLPFRVNSAGANPQLVLTVTDDDGPPAAPDVTALTGDGYVALSWTAVSNDSPLLRYEVRWRETAGGTFGAWQSVGLDTSYRVEGLTNDRAYEFEVRGVNAHGNGEAASAPGTPSERITGIPTAVRGAGPVGEGDGQQPRGAGLGPACERHRQGHQLEPAFDVFADPGLPDRPVPYGLRRRGELVCAGAEHAEVRAQIRAPGAGSGRDPGEPLSGAGDQHQRQGGPVVERGAARSDGGGERLSADAGRLDAVGPVPGAQPGRQQAPCALREHRHGLGGLHRAPSGEEGRRQAGADRPGCG